MPVDSREFNPYIVGGVIIKITLRFGPNVPREIDTVNV